MSPKYKRPAAAGTARRGAGKAHCCEPSKDSTSRRPGKAGSANEPIGRQRRAARNMCIEEPGHGGRPET